MGDINGFKKYKRALPEVIDPKNRIKHFKEFYKDAPLSHTKEQAARCMDCGIPFCHSACPLGNVIPDFNEAVYQEDWRKAYDILVSTNNFPEFTGRICPAPCEASCVLSIHNQAVTIEYIEKSIIEKAYQEGWVLPEIPNKESDKEVAIIGSGPAGLACADQLRKSGHQVTVYEKNDRVGGLLRYGIPDFKLEKYTIDRRIEIMKQSGIRFITNTHVGLDISAEELQANYDAVILCGGASVARDVVMEGRELNGIYPAMEFLEQNNRRVAGDPIGNEISVQGENIIVLGGGDTGSDCIGTSNRLGAKSITQIELLGKPPKERAVDNPWPTWPQILRTSSSHQEGCAREWAVLSKRFIGDTNGNLKGLEVVQVDWIKDEEGKYKMTEREKTKEVLPCTKAFIAIGFLHGEKTGIVEQLKVALDHQGNVETESYKTSVEGIFAAGDIRRGQSLVVWAIEEGRSCAKSVNQFLTKKELHQTNQSSVSYYL